MAKAKVEHGNDGRDGIVWVCNECRKVVTGVAAGSSDGGKDDFIRNMLEILDKGLPEAETARLLANMVANMGNQAWLAGMCTALRGRITRLEKRVAWLMDISSARVTTRTDRRESKKSPAAFKCEAAGS